MLNCKIPPRASHAGHDFVGDQQHPMPPASLRYALQVSRRRYHRTQSRSADRLKNKRGRLALRSFNRFFEVGCVLLPTVTATIRAVVSTAIAIGEPDMRELAHHRQIHLPPPLVPRNRQRPECRPVIALATADHLMPLALSNLDLILPRQFQRRLNRL